jgi:hypothetical protein
VALLSGCLAFIDRLSPALYQLIVPACHAENVTNFGAEKISASAQNLLIFAKLQQSIYLLTGVLLKSGENKK